MQYVRICRCIEVRECVCVKWKEIYTDIFIYQYALIHHLIFYGLSCAMGKDKKHYRRGFRTKQIITYLDIYFFRSMSQ